MKDYLESEKVRNKTSAHLFTAIMQKAFGNPSSIMIGHHLTFEFGGDLETENEIPSADTLIFDHAAMGKVFGGRAASVMADLAVTPCERRDRRLLEHFEELHGQVPGAHSACEQDIDYSGEAWASCEKERSANPSEPLSDKAWSEVAKSE
jgi:hypothetical protein